MSEQTREEPATSSGVAGVDVSSVSWVVTGGLGFIGTRLVNGLLRRGARVRIIDNLSVGSPAGLSCQPVERSLADCDQPWHPLELVVADIRDRQAMVQAVAGGEVLVHLAANTGVGPSVVNPFDDCAANVLGVLNVLDACRQHGFRRFVLASSGAPLAGNEPPLTETMAPRPLSPYGASKLAGEGYCSAYYGSYGLSAVALRFGNVYGPGSAHKESVVAKFIKAALAGQVLEVYGDGQQTRDFVYIDDLLEAVERAALLPDLGSEVFQIATNRERTVGELVELLREVIERRTGRTVQVVHGDERAGDARRNYSDVSKAREILGFSPRYTLQEGLEATLDYFLS